MTDEWIRQMVNDRKRREQAQTEARAVADAAAQAMKAAAEPYWNELCDELTRIVTLYNEALGQQDLEVRAHGEVLVISRPKTHVRVAFTSGTRIDLESRIDGRWHQSHLELSPDGDGVRGQIGDGSATAAAKHAFAEWMNLSREK